MTAGPALGAVALFEPVVAELAVELACGEHVPDGDEERVADGLAGLGLAPAAPIGRPNLLRIRAYLRVGIRSADSLSHRLGAHQ